MKIAILGTGMVGQALASGFKKYGHDVVMGTQHTDKKIEWKDPSMEGTIVESYRDAAKAGDFVVLTVKGAAAVDVAQEVAAEVSGKTVIDTTNPIADAPPVNGVLTFFTDLNESLMEKLQKAAPDAHFVKAFNSIGAAFMVNPDFGETPTMFICGNDEGAKQQVAEISKQFGFEVEDMGKAEAARAIEPLCILWCIPGMLNNHWTHAFKLLKKG